MANQQQGPSRGRLPSSDTEWIIEARKHRYLGSVRELLEKGTGYGLNGGQVYIEACGIIVFLLKETLMFEGMLEDETRITVFKFVKEYLSLRDEKEYSAMNNSEPDSVEFKRCRLKLLKATNNNINKKIEPKPFFLSLEKTK